VFLPISFYERKRRVRGHTRTLPRRGAKKNLGLLKTSQIGAGGDFVRYSWPGVTGALIHVVSQLRNPRRVKFRKSGSKIMTHGLKRLAPRLIRAAARENFAI